MEVVVSDTQLPGVLDTKIAETHTGNVGDGKIFVLNLTEIIRIRKW